MAGTIELSVVSHTNSGKTTLARTLLSANIGEVRDEAHVTSAAEPYTMIATADVPGARGSMAGPEGVLVVGLRRPEHAALNGLTLAQIAEQRGQEWPDALIDLVLAEGPWASAIYFLMTEENLAPQMRQPWIKFSTDAGGMDPASPGSVLVHPRAYGTYPRVLGKYVREEGVIPLEDAIRKMTSSVADRLSLRDRGLLRTGSYADVVIFDPATIADPSADRQFTVGRRYGRVLEGRDDR